MLRFICCSILAMLACGTYAADEAKKPDSEAAAMKAMIADKKADPPKAEQTWKGLLGLPSTSTGTGAEATLQIASAEDKFTPSKKLQLFPADATVSAELAELLKLHGLAEVTGVLGIDNVSVKVTKIVKVEMHHHHHH